MSRAGRPGRTETAVDDATDDRGAAAHDASRLGPDRRREALLRMSRETFDIVVVGGGVTGCGVALDAATRGLSVALVEMRDYAAGTSSRSGKLIHGGLRYLEQLDFTLVREALRERGLMLQQLCPHLVKPVEFIYPLERRVWERAYVGAGVALYDTLGGAGAVPRHRHLTRRGALRVAPALRPGGLVGAVSFHDAQVDDARHTMMLARTAAAHGAAVASAARVIGLLRDGQRVTGVRVRDAESGEEFPVRARHVVAAAGVWTGDLQEQAGRPGDLRVRASKGVHIMVPRERIASDAAMLVRAEDSMLFVRPWGRHWLLGTTDTRWDLDLHDPAANRGDIDYLLRNVNRVLAEPLARADVEGAFAGLRPLLSGRAEATSRLSREHAVATPLLGLTVIAGGKYTTYRVMAADAVDAAGRDLAPHRRVPATPTSEVPLVGAEGYPALWEARHRLAEQAGLAVPMLEHLLGRYGSLTHELLALLRERPGLAEPIPGAEGYLKAEARYAVTHEGALRLDDVLTRRLHAAIETRDGGVRAAQSIAPLVGQALGWDATTISNEVERYRSQVAAARTAQEQLDDTAADAARLVTRDPRIVSGAGAAPSTSPGGTRAGTVRGR